MLVVLLTQLNDSVLAQSELTILSRMRYSSYASGVAMAYFEGKHYLRTSDGGIIIRFGYINHSITSCHNPPEPFTERVFAKFDPTGQHIEWERCYDGDSAGSVTSIFPTWNNELIEVCESSLYWTIRKVDWAGSLIWQRAYQVSAEQLFSVQTLDGGYIIAGRSSGIGGEIPFHYGSSLHDDVFLLKVDSTGQKVWGNVFGGSRFDSPLRIFPTTDGGCFLVGNTQSNDYDCTGYHDATSTGGDVWMMRIDGAGGKVWHKCLGGSQRDVGYDAFYDDSGIYLMCNNRSVDGDIQNHIGMPGSKNIWLLKTDTSGNIIWQKNYDADTAFAEYFSMALDSLGRIWATGVTRKKAEPFADVMFGGYCDAIVGLFDNNGDLLARRVIGTPQADMGAFVAPMASGVTLVGGNYMPPVTNETVPDDTSSFVSFFLNRLIDWTTYMPGLNPQPTLQLKIFPNPASEEVFVSSVEQCEISIWNMYGNRLSVDFLQPNIPKRLQVNQWPKGVYIIEGRTQSVICTSKLIVQ